MAVALVEQQQPEENLCTFTNFWMLQLKKVGRMETEREWNKIDPALYPEIITAWAAWRSYYIAKEQDPHFLLDPRRWLHNQRWTDELPREQRQASHMPAKSTPLPPRGEIPEHVKAMMRRIKEGK